MENPRKLAAALCATISDYGIDAAADVIGQDRGVARADALTKAATLVRYHLLDYSAGDYLLELAERAKKGEF